MDENEKDTAQNDPVNTEPPEETVGDIMHKSGSEAVKFWVIIISAFVYLAGIVYAEVHGLAMLQKGVREDLRIWATMGMVAAGISAVLFPVALKTWTIEAKQRIAAYAFYALDFGFLVFNAFTDFNTNTGQQLAPWAQSYVTYVLPASPIVVAACWALLWELDPGVREKIMLLTLRAAMKQKMADKVADAARGANVTQAVNEAARREVDRALTELFGTPVHGYVMNSDEMPQRKGWLQSFFGWLSALGPLMSSPTTPSQPQEPNSETEQPKA